MFLFMGQVEYKYMFSVNLQYCKKYVLLYMKMCIEQRFLHCTSVITVERKLLKLVYKMMRIRQYMREAEAFLKKKNIHDSQKISFDDKISNAKILEMQQSNNRKIHILPIVLQLKHFPYVVKMLIYFITSFQSHHQSNSSCHNCF